MLHKIIVLISSFVLFIAVKYLLSLAIDINLAEFLKNNGVGKTNLKQFF